MRTLANLVGVASACWCLSAAAENPDQLDWPVQTLFLTDTAQVQDPGTVQLESGVRLNDTDTGSQFIVPSTIQAGVLPRLQLEAIVPWMRETQSGIVDASVPNVEVGADFRLVDSRDSAFAASVGLAVAAPPTTTERRAQGYTVLPRFRAFKQLGVVGLSGTVDPGVTLAAGPQRDITPLLVVGAGLTFGHGTLVPTVEGRAITGTDNEDGVRGSAGVRYRPWQPFEIGLAALGGTQEGGGVFGGALDLVLELGQ